MRNINSSGLKKYLAVLFLIINSGIAFAQSEYQIRQLKDDFRTNKMITGEWKRGLTLDDIDGTPFLEKEYTTGTIYTIQKQKFVDVPLRYNMYNDQIEFRNSNGAASEFATPDDVEKIEFGSYEFRYVKFADGKKGFLQVLESGNAVLYAQHKVIFRDKKPPSAYHDAERARFEKIPGIFFIGFGDASVKQVANKKELVQVFPDHQAEIEAFISKNKIKTNKPEGLTELVKFYNTL